MEKDFAVRFFEKGSSSGRFTSANYPMFPIENLPQMDFNAPDLSIEPFQLGFQTILTRDLLCFEPFSYIVDDPPPFQLKQLMETTNFADRRLKSVELGSEKLKSPKIEVEGDDRSIYTVHRDMNSPTDVGDQSLMLLPFQDLHSFEQIPDLEDPSSLSHLIHDFSTVGSSQKRLKTSSPPNASYLPLALPKPNRAPPSVFPRCTLARQRRKNLSDRTRYLEKLMPGEKKMDTATLLEEAYKYVRFLEAQVSALQDMPVLSGLPPSGPFPVRAKGFSGLEKLNRQQMLQVLVNSARVQEKLYSSGCCIFSYEQTAMMKKVAEKKALLQQLMLLG